MRYNLTNTHTYTAYSALILDGIYSFREVKVASIHVIIHSRKNYITSNFEAHSA